MGDSDLVLCQYGRERRVHDRCVEVVGPCPCCGVVWSEEDGVGFEPGRAATPTAT
jgi:hypothetical protein